MTRILVVDDDEPLRTAIGRDLRHQGYEVELAGSVEEALAALVAQPADVLLTDLRMSGADGIDLLKAARLMSSNMRALLMSGFGTARDYQTAIDLGAVRVLCKPFTSAELLQAIRQAVECATGFRGSVHGLALVDVLQMFHLARRSVAIWIDSEDHASGVVHLCDGAVVHAAIGQESGESALSTLLGLRSGALRTVTLGEPGPRTIERDFQSVVLDALRRLDESSSEHELSLDDWELERPAPVTDVPAEPDVELAVRAAWESAWKQIAPTPIDPVAVAALLRTGRQVALHGRGGEEIAGAMAATLGVVDRLCGGTRFGVLECGAPSVAVFLIWDRQRELAVALGDVVRSAGDSAMVRTAAWTLARHLLGPEHR